MGFISFFDGFTFILVTFWLLRELHTLKHGSRYLMALLMYLFYVMPLGLDTFILKADYSYSGWWGFISPRNDLITNIIYDLSLLYFESIILFFRKPRSISLQDSDVVDIGNYKYLLLLFAAVPPIAVIALLRQPAMLYTFQWRELELFPTGGSYSTIERFTYIGVACSSLLIFYKSNKANFLLKLLSFSLLLINICIQGKRAIMFYALINIALIIYQKLKNTYVNKKKMVLYGLISVSVVAVIIIFMISMTVATKVGRGYSVDDTDKMYTTTRIDFLRDDRVRLAIYSELYPEEVKIVNYPMQTFITDIFAFIPMNYIKEMLGVESYAYQTHFSYALEKKISSGTLDVRNMSYMTVTFVSEIISNIGLIGILIIPFMCLKIVKWIDKNPYPFNILIISAFVLVNLFDFTYVAVFIEVVIMMCFFYNKSKRKVHKVTKFSNL